MNFSFAVEANGLGMSTRARLICLLAIDVVALPLLQATAVTHPAATIVAAFVVLGAHPLLLWSLDSSSGGAHSVE